MSSMPHETLTRYLTWTGMETDLIFNRAIDLPGFASFPLLGAPDTRNMVQAYAQDQIAVAAGAGFGTILESATWMANLDRAKPLGYDAADLAAVNKDAVALLAQVRAASGAQDVLISANLGPRDDAYAPADIMSADAAERYHSAQIASLMGTDADFVSPYTLSNSQEAIGIARAAATADLACVVAFTVETDGRLPSGQPLDAAIAQPDHETGGSPAYYMVNCAQPDHFAANLTGNPRIAGIVVNASRCSHAELDEATELDDGDPDELGAQVAAIVRDNPMIRVIGGCCGTDMRHLKALVDQVERTA